jgi:D-alanyl-D-alanine carboxypeptidase
MEHEQKISKNLFIFNIVLVFAVILMTFLLFQNSQEKKQQKVVEAKVVKKSLAVFDNVNVKAKAVVVYDLADNRVLYAKNAGVQLPLASITKLMTALVATELLPKDSNITIKSEFLIEEGDSGLVVNESWNLKELLDFSLVTSSNDGVRSVASVIGAVKLNSKDYDLGRKDFIEKMNKRAKELGLAQTFFVNETGLDVGNVSGGYGSANDVTSLVKYMVRNQPEILESTKFSRISIDSNDKKHTAKNTNDIVNEIPGLFVSKTGYTDMAGGNLVVAFDPSLGKPIVITVLGSTQEGRFEDVDLLVQTTLEYLNQ